jgi:hypothetical protein
VGLAKNSITQPKIAPAPHSSLSTLPPCGASSGATLAFYRKPVVDYRLVYETRLKLIRGNYADGSEEPKLRAFEFAVRFCRDHHNSDLETAKTMVAAAIKRSANGATGD